MDNRRLFDNVRERIRYCERLKRLYSHLPAGEFRLRMEDWLREELQLATQTMVQLLQQR